MFLNTPSCRTIFCLYVLLSIIGDCPVIASDNCTQKYAHCIVFCSLRTSGLYNEWQAVDEISELLIARIWHRQNENEKKQCKNFFLMIHQTYK